MPGIVVLAVMNIAGAASASIWRGPATIIVRSGLGSATITRSPFRVTFSDARGTAVLRETPTSTRRLTLVRAAAPPLAMYGPPLQGTLYAPLEFTVGTESDTARTSGTWAGDLLSSGRTGTVYSALRLRSDRRSGRGVTLVVSTSDPTGRLLIVSVYPDRTGAFRVSVRPSPATGVVGIGDTFASTGGEQFHGFGGRHLGLSQRGGSFYNWTDEENVNAASFKVPGSAAGTLLYPNGPQAAYYPQASFISSHRYGFLLDQPELARFRMDSDRTDAWQADVAAPRLDYVVAPGVPGKSIAALTAITGRQRVPPAWAVAPELDRETQLGQQAAQYEARVRQDLVDIVRHHLPIRSYRIEGWGILPTATVRELIGEFRRRGIHVLLYFRPFVSQDAAGTETPGLYAYAVSHGLVARTRSGAPAIFGDSFGSPAALLDFTNPATVSWWDDRLRAALDLGADGFMQDFGEQVLPGMVFHDGETAATMHNRYPVLYHRATRTFLDAYGAKHRDRGFFFFTRAGYTGNPGSAAYENGNFPGDETTDWTRSSGIASVVPDMLNRAVGGAFGYTTDIGGYFDIYTPAPTTKELLLRWAELSVFTPFFRLHGSLIAGTHLPWRYDAETVSTYNHLAALHQRAAGLILKLWRAATRTGVPPTRPLWLDYPTDRTAAAQDQEWLLGPDLLVAPVVQQGARSRPVYLPAGCWRTGTTGHRYGGRRMVRISAGLTVLPWFTRCGRDPLRAGA